MSIGTTAKIIKQFSRNIENLFFVLLYREIALKITQEFEDPLPILKRLGTIAAETSCKQHKTLLKLIKPKPGDLVNTITLIWYVVFGQQIEFEHETIENNTTDSQGIIIKIKKCPLCSGLDKESYFNTLPLEKLKKHKDGYACVLLSMLEGATNYIMALHKQPYKIEAREIGCQLYGQPLFKLKFNMYKIA
ncbi:MAG: hypothetical protein HWN67_19120 [Candidatus Helarchaeota archaeon]|nr:hypothetical protein [Candidatus Helarchaeota archaeon]